MHIAVLGDIHGNLLALEAVLKTLRHSPPDLIVIAGDMVNCSPDSKACVDLLSSLKLPMIRGNHEGYLADFEKRPELQGERFKAVQFSAKQFSYNERQALGHLPLSWSHPDVPDLLIVHSSLRSDSDRFDNYASEQDMLDMFAGAHASYIIRAHYHRSFYRYFAGHHLHSIGSVGLALSGKVRAEYALLHYRQKAWHIEHKSVPYDSEAQLQRFYDSGLVEQGGAMMRLFMRELALATPQITPFVAQYARWSKAGELSLAQAVDNFLNAF